MEPHKQLDGIEEYRPDLASGPQEYFRKALMFAIDYYGEQMDEISSVKFEKVAPEYFWREYIWVVHATGFSAKAVGKFMPRLAAAYGNYWELAELDFDFAFSFVKPVCNNPQKAKAVWKTAQLLRNEMIEKKFWPEVRQELISTPEKLKELPYIGKVTCFHLARNIGLLDFVKPDLHLIRMAEYWKFKDCVEMCKAVQPVGMPLGIVDLVLWYSASTFGTLDIRQEGQR
jgi:endonuclease III